MGLRVKVFLNSFKKCGRRQIPARPAAFPSQADRTEMFGSPTTGNSFAPS